VHYSPNTSPSTGVVIIRAVSPSLKLTLCNVGANETSA